ncbi:MAG: sialidase family protein [Planctomycetota bacterium]|nr:sialidase family protein [Planctomycetota bacterium]
MEIDAKARTDNKNAVERIQVAPPGPNNPRNGEGGLIRLNDGRLFLVYGHYTKGSGDHDTADLLGCYSSDGGKTWTDPVMVVKNKAEKNTISVSLLRLQNGHIAMFYLRTNSKVDCRPVMQISTDECKSWSAPRFCIKDPAYYILNNDRAVQLKNGRIVLPLANHNHPKWKQRDRNGIIMCYLSDDNGHTWRRSKDAIKAYSPAGKRCLVQEPGVVELGYGRLMMFCRTEMGSQYVSFSGDGGETWSKFGPSNITSPLSPASIKRIPKTGDLLLVWNNIEHDPNFLMKRTRLNTAISRDDGRTWEKTKTIEQDSRYGYCYTAIEFWEDNAVLSYMRWKYKDDTLGVQVTRIPLDWIYK